MILSTIPFLLSYKKSTSFVKSHFTVNINSVYILNMHLIKNPFLGIFLAI